MNQSRPLGVANLLLLLLVVLLAAGARAGFLVYYADYGRQAGPFHIQEDPWPLLLDQPHTENELTVLIQSVKESNRYEAPAPLAKETEQTAHYSPGYPWLVGLLARVVPEEQLDFYVRWIQCGLGTLTAGLYFLFALRAFWYSRVALLAGLFCALYPYWIANTAQINDGVVSSFFLACCLYFGLRGIQTSGPFASLLYGLALAALALVRASALLFSFVGLAWFLLRSRNESRGWLCSLLAFLGFVNGLAPWAVRNYQLYQEPIPVISSTWLHLWVGNNPQATGGPLTAQMRSLFTETERTRLAKLRQPFRYADLGKTVREEILAAPTPTFNRRLHATAAFLLGDYLLTKGTVIPTEGLPSDRIDYESILLLVLILMLGLAFLGWRWTYAWRKDSMPAALAIVWLPIPYLLGHAEELHGPRLPLDGILLCYAAFALICLIPGLGTNLLEGRKPPVEPEDTGR
jgi:hypothetical protein